MPQRVPIETGGWRRILLWVFLVLLRQQIEEGQELALDHVVVARVPAASIRKHELVGLLAFGPQLPFLEHQDKWLSQRDCSHPGSRLGNILVAIGVDPGLKAIGKRGRADLIIGKAQGGWG